MSDVKKVIDGLEHEIARANIADLEWLDCVEVELLCDALALLKAQEHDIADMRNDLQDTLAENLCLSDLLKAQEPIEARLHLCESCAKEYAECEADKTDLVYGSGVGNDNIIGCPWYMNRWKVQEPVEPKIIDTANSKLYHNDIFKNYYCGNCGEFLHVVNRKDLFCSQCGRQVKWNG